MSCPLNRKRFAGSGYTKECAPSSSASALEKRMAEMLAIREAQNAGNFSARMSEPALPGQPQPGQSQPGLSPSSHQPSQPVRSYM
jgi:hypothetical protein